MFSTWMQSAAAKYQRIETPEQKCDHSSASYTPGSHRCFVLLITCGIVSILAFALGFAASSFVNHPSCIQPSNTYEAGFDTEIASLLPAIQLVKTLFSGTLRYKGEHLYIDLGTGGIRYFGEPSDEVDDAWTDLIGNDEGTFAGDVIAPDVLHSLHCVNEVRKVLDSQYYYNATLESLNRGRRIHIDHCLNHIRQVIQCHMDLTPVRAVYFEDMNTEVGDFDQEHMCRDTTRLHEWMGENDVAVKNDGQTIEDGQRHLLGYPDNAEALRSWEEREGEFE
ncbi:hypothetical protein DE146DRAFT_760490 [Phaeosphaeria sp. MPI-PUGE-AT-0046c]|nr:hypothetical protein DE146DRAFT_760490 [Phaeosphaeria sp. MPI-PUGE-AT-0046c]